MNTTTCTTSDASGNVTFTDLPVGTHSLKVSKEGFITEEAFEFSIVGDQTTTETLALSPNLANDKNWRIVLTWDTVIRDLDAFFWTPSGHEVSYNMLGDMDSAPFAKLEIDNIDAPNAVRIETIQLDCQDGTYSYAVVNQSASSGGYDVSQARVQKVDSSFQRTSCLFGHGSE